MNILQVISPVVQAEDYGRVGATRVASLLLTEAHSAGQPWAVLANDPNRLLESFTLRDYHISRSRTYGVDVYKRLVELAPYFDIVVTHLQYLGFVSYINKLAEQFPQVQFVQVHHTPPDTGTDITYRYKDDYGRHFDLPNVWTVCVSKSHRERLCATMPPRWPTERISYIHNGVVWREIEERERDFDVIVVARLDSSKRVLDSIMFSLAATDGPIMYVGSAEQTSSRGSKMWEEYLKTFNQLKAVHSQRLMCMGAVNNIDVITKLMPRAKVNVNLSPIETFGLTAVEAAMAGTPSIVENKGGLDEVVHQLVIGESLDFHRKRWGPRAELVKSAYDSLHEKSDFERYLLKSKVKDLFTSTRMYGRYLALFEQIQGG